MHEIGMLYQIADTTSRFAEEYDIDAVKGIKVQVGELSGVLPELFTEYFNYVMEQYPRLHSAKLDLQMIRAEGLCEDCNCLYNVSKHDGLCPRCHSPYKKMLGGTEIRLSSITY